MEDEQSQLKSLLESFLPPHTLTHAEVENFTVSDLCFKVAGVALNLHDGKEIFGASSSLDERCPLLSAGYECLERFVVLNHPSPEAGKAYEYSRSNGVAVHPERGAAEDSALLELCERNEILKSWYFNSPIRHLNPSDYVKPLLTSAFLRDFQVRLADVSTLPGYSVIGVFAFPKVPERNLVYGFGAGRSRQQACEKAQKEFLTRLAFLWDQTPDEKLPEKPGPHFHQEFYLRKENERHISEWLNEENSKKKVFNRYLVSSPKFHDLTPPEWKGRLSVVKAYSRDSIPLFFGHLPRDIFDFEYRYDIPHPIA